MDRSGDAAVAQHDRRRGTACRYAGTAGDTDVYLVGSGSRRARLAVDRKRGSIELWDELPDPNGAPFAWAYDRGTDATVVADVVIRAVAAGGFEPT